MTNYGKILANGNLGSLQNN